MLRVLSSSSIIRGCGVISAKPSRALVAANNCTVPRVSLIMQQQQQQPFITGNAYFSSTVNDDDDGEGKLSEFAVVNHGTAYDTAWDGLHGRQLSLALLEGEGKDDLPFDPFSDDEYESDDDDDSEQQLELDDSNTVDVKFSETKPSAQGSSIQTTHELESDDDDDSVDIDPTKFNRLYNNDGSLKRTKAEKAILRAGAPAGGLFAVIEMAGTQHKVTTDDLLIVNRIKPIDSYKVGSIHTLTNVLLVASTHRTCVGLPYVAGAEVDVMVEEVTRDAKVVVFKKRRRKNSQRRNGFRRDVSMLRVLDIRMPEAQEEHVHRERLEPAELPVTASSY